VTEQEIANAVPSARDRITGWTARVSARSSAGVGWPTPGERPTFGPRRGLRRYAAR